MARARTVKELGNLDRAFEFRDKLKAMEKQMSMPHTCECKICGAKMGLGALLDPRPGAVMPAIIGGGAQPGVSIPAAGWICTKHGLIFGPDCEHCRAEQVPTPAEPK